MKRNSLKTIAYFLGSAAILTACGGSTDDEAGAPAALKVEPAEMSVTSGTGTCSEISSGGVLLPVVRVFPVGGTAPYRVESTIPAAMSVSPAVVANRGEFFEVYLRGGCLTDATVLVVDSLNTAVTFSMTYSDEAEAE